MPAHQLPGPLDGVPDVEQLADQRLDPAQRPALVPGEPVRQRAFPQLGLQPGPLLRAEPLPRHRPPRPSASVPPSRQARCHRRTDPSVTRRSRAISVIPSPRANRPAASSRSRSRRCCSAGVYPPRCAYRMPRSYAHRQPTSRPELYEFNLVITRHTRGRPVFTGPTLNQAESRNRSTMGRRAPPPRIRAPRPEPEETSRAASPA